MKKEYAQTVEASRKAEYRRWKPEEGRYTRGGGGHIRNGEGLRATK
jgi:hypothetical protein